MYAFCGKVIGFLQKLNRSQRGIAAIPTIITTISFAAAAGTLGTAVVNQGNNASQQAAQVIRETVANIQGTYQLRGSVIGVASKTGSNGSLGQITFDLSLASGGGSIDFTPPNPSPDNNGLADPTSQNIIIISYTDANQHVDNLYWTLKQSGKSNGNNLLEEDEIFQITVGGSPIPGQNGGNLVNALSKPLSTDTDFEIQVQAPQGATLGIDRRTPPYFTNITNFRY